MRQNAITKLSNRDRWLLTALPALLVLVGYVFVFERSQSTAIHELNAKVAAARPRTASIEHIREQQAELDRLGARMASLRGSASQASVKNLSVPRKLNKSAERPAAMAALSRLLETHGMTVVSTARLAEPDGKPAAELNVKQWLAQTGVANEDLQPELWKVELVGDYGQMLDVLTKLPELERVVVPLQLSMDQADPGTSLRRWFLVFII